MRILYVHERFGALAGAESSVLITAGELAKRGHEIAILHGPETGRGQAQWSETFPTRFLLSGDGALTTSQAIQSFRPDVFYINKMAELPVMQQILESGIPVARMVHDHDIYCMRSYKYSYFTRRICTRSVGPHCIFPCLAFAVKNDKPGFPLKWVSYRAKKREVSMNRRIHRMIVVTHYMREELLRNGFDPKRIVILPPIPRSVEPVKREANTRNLILYVGQIVRGKGVDVLLQSLALLTVPFECIILGDGNHRAYCERLCQRLGLAERVKFKGFVPQEELKTYYRQCAVIAISSVWPEPIATIGLEVMRHGLPVVAFDAGGIKDWLTDGVNGYLVPWMDRRTYAKRLQTLLTNPELANQMGQEGLKRACERYDFTQYIQRLEETLREAICEARADAGWHPDAPQN